MSKIMVGVYNHNTGQNEVREATLQEIEIMEIANAELAKLDAISKAKEEARQSAIAKLAKLGLSEDEIAAL